MSANDGMNIADFTRLIDGRVSENRMTGREAVRFLEALKDALEPRLQDAHKRWWNDIKTEKREETIDRPGGVGL